MNNTKHTESDLLHSDLAWFKFHVGLHRIQVLSFQTATLDSSSHKHTHFRYSRSSDCATKSHVISSWYWPHRGKKIQHNWHVKSLIQLITVDLTKISWQWSVEKDLSNLSANVTQNNWLHKYSTSFSLMYQNQYWCSPVFCFRICIIHLMFITGVESKCEV